MPLLATRGGGSVQGFGRHSAAVPVYIEDIFSTYLYTGNGSTQTINNGIQVGPIITTSGFSNDTNLEAIYTTPGTYSWTAPAGVTSVSVVAVGGGGGNAGGGAGAGGGGLGWKNNISVTPGNSYTVVVGAGGNTQFDSPLNNGGDSYFINTSTVKGGGGSGFQASNNYAGGTFTGDGGGNGGKGTYATGGGAGGYLGNGGYSRVTNSAISYPGFGGAGDASPSWASGASGTGVGIYGVSTGNSTGNGGPTTAYGQGGGNGLAGGNGAVRIIWGVGRSFPYAAGYISRLVSAGNDYLVWVKGRTHANNHQLRHFINTVPSDGLATNVNTAARSDLVKIAPVSGSTGFNVIHFDPEGVGLDEINRSGLTYTSWTFRKQPKFFDVVTYTGNGVNGRTVAHNLGSAPGCVIVKRTDLSSNWIFCHRSANFNMWLNSTSGEGAGEAQLDGFVQKSSLSSTTFTLFSGGNGITAVNQNGATYVAYLFAHDAGGFGASGSDNVISCGSFTHSNTVTNNIDVGYEPQWVLVKNATTSSGWIVLDINRAFGSNNNIAILYANSSAVEQVETGSNYLGVYQTGFRSTPSMGGFGWVNGDAIIYIAIRRGPMKTPTTGTSVFLPNVGNGSVTGNSVTTVFPVDAAITSYRSLGGVGATNDRLRGFGNSNTAGVTPKLQTSSTDAESAAALSNPYFYNAWNTTILRGSNGADPGGAGIVTWFFGRAPGFFDVVCYTGTGSGSQTVTHNLSAVPELIITRARSSTDDWYTYSATVGNTKTLYLNGTAAASTASSNYWNNTSPTSTQFTAGPFRNGSATYVAYLFATCPGVSKVGSYTGNGGTVNNNGTSQTINCGFSGGARFVLIKRTDSTGDWYTFDTARGIVAGNDPYLLLNSEAAEVTSVDAVDTDSSGFIVNQTSGTNLNVTGATYIYLAIA